MLPDTFQTSRLNLRPIAVGDVGPIFDGYAQDKEVTRFLIWGPHQDRGVTEAFIARCVATPPDVERTYVLVGRGDLAIRGAFSLRRTALYRLECGYVLAREWWGLGLMTEVLSEVAHWALRQPEIFRISAVCDVGNIASARVMEEAGLIRGGLLRRWLVHPNISDKPRDCFAYAKAR